MQSLSSRLQTLLSELYADRAPDIGDRIMARLAQFMAAEDTAVPPRWNEGDILLITYGDSLQENDRPPLQTLRTFLNDHLAEAISGVHVLPFFPYSSDDGFSVVDYSAVDGGLGGWDDIRGLARDYRLMVDLVINHVSRESLWFTDFLTGQGPGRDYFIEMSPSLDLSQVVRPRSHPLLVPVQTRRGVKHLWATFSDDQIDLNFANPDVLLEFVDILLLYLQQGADIIRLDAIAFLWKQLGTPCIHLPQTHAVVKLLRLIMEAVRPGAILLTETNVPHRENLSYFGEGDEAHMVYQFALPPLVLYALVSGDGSALNAWASSLEAPRAGCTMLNFMASHDGIGVRPIEGLVTSEALDRLLDAMHRFGGYVSMKANSDGSESPYEINIAFFDACKGTLQGEDGWQIRRFLCAQLIMLALQGVPAVYIHSLLATPNDIDGVERSGRTRAINRRKWQLSELGPVLEAPFSPQRQVFDELRRLLAVRRKEPAFHPDAPQRILDLGPGLFAVERKALGGRRRLVAVHNLQARPAPLDWSALGLGPAARDCLGGQIWRGEEGKTALQPYQCVWLSAVAS